LRVLPENKSKEVDDEARNFCLRTSENGVFSVKKDILSMKQHTKSTKSTWKIDPCDCRQVDIARLFNVTAQCVAAWSCPRLASGNYVLSDVIEWRAGQQEKATSPKLDLENEKLSLQCQKLKIEIDDLKKPTISLDEAREKLHKHVDEAMTFFIDFGAINLHLIVGRTIEEVHRYWSEIVHGAFKGMKEALE
jgi:hypothetical protein